jgi:integrase
VNQKEVITHAQLAAAIKGIFKANRCPLQVSFNTTFTKSTRKISTGILKAIYQSLPRNELRLIIDLQAYAGERVAAICRNTGLDQWEDYGAYTLIHVRAEHTKARNDHICIIPRSLADTIRQYAAQTGRTIPFPNYETLWREITHLALDRYDTRITSHYLRKRFHTIAGKTAMPVNSWDYLMGDKQTHGHNAGTYTLEDFSQLVQEYDKFLASFLSIGEPREPDEPINPTKQTPDLNALLKTIETLQETIRTLTHQLSEARTR